MKTFNNLKKIRILLVLALFIGSTFTAQSQNGWEHMSWMEQPTLGSGSCVSDSLIYVIGGSDANSSIVKTVLVYNTVTNKWDQKHNLLFELTNTNIGLINNKVFLAGGWRKNGSSNSTFLYDHELDTWEKKAYGLKSSGGNASCVLNNKLYLFGGLKDDQGFDMSGQKDVHVYDPASDKWEELLPEMKHARGKGAAACVYDGKVYVFGGGYHFNEYTFYTAKNPERYDPFENSWTELAEMPVPVLNHGSVVYNNKIYIFGGDTIDQNEVPVSFVQEYDPLTNSWRLLENMPFPISNFVCQKVGNFVYLIGGYLSSSRLSEDVWRFNLDDLKEGCKEVVILEPSKPFAVGDTFAMYLKCGFSDGNIIWSSDNEEVAKASVDGVISCLAEGTTKISVTLNDGESSDSYWLTVIAPSTWTQMKSIPQATSWYGSCIDTVSEKAYFFGGQAPSPSDAVSLISTTQIYDFKTDTWSSGANMPKPASALSAEMVNGKIYLIGEYMNPPQLTNVLEYDPVSDIWTIKELLPEIFWAHGSCVYNGLIYSFGGREVPFNLINTTRTYNPLTDTWTDLQDMPYKRDNPAVCVYKDEIYLFGGNPSLKYTPSTNIWTELNAGECDILAYATPIIDGNRIVLFGGYKEGSYPVPSNEIWVYYPDNDSLVRHENDMPFDRFTEGYKYNNNVYLFGGNFGNSMGSVTNEVWRFNLDSLKPMSSAVSNSNLINLNEVTIYPNPANMQITIETGIQGPYIIEITTLNGQLLLGKEVEGSEHQLNLYPYPSGVYFITLKSKDFAIARKIIKY